MIAEAIASRTASAPWPASAGPFLTRGLVPWPSIGGRCSSIVNRVERSTRVPIAELSSPTIRSPAQRPAGAQVRRQLTPQRTAALDIQGLVDRLVRDPHGLIIREIGPQPVRDLLRAPRPGPAPIRPATVTASDPGHIRAGHSHATRPGDRASEPVLHILPQDLVRSQFCDLRTPCPQICVPLSGHGPVLQPATPGCSVPAQLPRDR